MGASSWPKRWDKCYRTLRSWLTSISEQAWPDSALESKPPQEGGVARPLLSPVGGPGALQRAESWADCARTAMWAGGYRPDATATVVGTHEGAQNTDIVKIQHARSCSTCPVSRLGIVQAIEK